MSYYTIRPSTLDEEQKAKRLLLWGSILAIILIMLLTLVGWPSDSWSPTSAFDFLRCFLQALIFSAVGLALLGAVTLIQDYMVRSSTPGSVI